MSWLPLSSPAFDKNVKPYAFDPAKAKALLAEARKLRERGKIEKALMPITSRLGFRTEFPFERYADWATANGSVELVERLLTAPPSPIGSRTTSTSARARRSPASIAPATTSRGSSRRKARRLNLSNGSRHRMTSRANITGGSRVRT